jgi:hypothetical protein
VGAGNDKDPSWGKSNVPIAKKKKKQTTVKSSTQSYKRTENKNK